MKRFSSRPATAKPEPRSEILPGGTRRAVHVFVPALKGRLDAGWKENDGGPVIAVRSALYGYEKMRLYRKVEILGPSELVELPEALPGTKGRGVAILFTEHALRVWYDGPNHPETIDTADAPGTVPALAA